MPDEENKPVEQSPAESTVEPNKIPTARVVDLPSFEVDMNPNVKNGLPEGILKTRSSNPEKE